MKKYKYEPLLELVDLVCRKAGFPEDRARINAETLIEADLMGHTTHGLGLLDPYLKDAEKGGMKMSGDPIVVKDSGASVTWDGQYMSGTWLVREAMELAFDRVKEQPVVSVAISRSHHIACLAAYPEIATDKGLMMLLSCSDPMNATVAPFGGKTGVYSPNPLAVGIPTESSPIIMDISMSSTANGLVNKKKAEGARLPQKWLLGSDGVPTDDPNTFFESPPSTILPLGGLETGYKGFALGLLIDILTSGLAGHGRADHPTSWGASVFLQIIDPEGFGGLANFQKQSQHLVDACLANEPHDKERPVRIPGSRALQLKDKHKKEGLPLGDGIVDALIKWSDTYGIDSGKYLLEG